MSSLLLLNIFFIIGQNKTPFEKDKEAILKMTGIYKVNFDFAETFSNDTSYKFYPRYKEWGIEYVFPLETSNNKIVLQHLLIINDSTIIKHWRQDWVYQNTELLQYKTDKAWEKKYITADQAKGTWTQKVYQVDDSPRYESYGTWNHVDGRHFWEATADAPLPRRDLTKRADYNVMRRHMKIEILSDGWILDQDNEKIVKTKDEEKQLCWEKGHERFVSGNHNAEPAQKWWNTHQKFWTDTRLVWEKILTNKKEVKMKKNVDGFFLYEKLFDLDKKYANASDYNSSKVASEIEKTIKTFLD